MDRASLTPLRLPGGRTLVWEAAGEGPAVALLHAGIADADMWDGLAADLAPSHRVVRFDLAGFGSSPLPIEPFSNVRDLAAVLDAAGVERATLAGVSFGAGVALGAALEIPERVAGLVLAAPGLPGWTWSPGVAAAMEEEDAAFERGDFAAAAETCVRLWVVGPRRTPADVDPGLCEDVRRWCVRSYERLAEALRLGEPAGPERLDPPALERLGEVAAPTVVVVGDADVPDMAQAADLLEAGIPGARKIVWEGVAHLPPLERPGEFAALVRGVVAASA